MRKHTVIVCAFFCALLAMAYPGEACAVVWSGGDVLVPGTIYDHSAARNATLLGDISVADPGGNVTFIFNNTNTSMFNFRNGTLRIGNSTHTAGDALTIRGEDPTLSLRGGKLLIDAGSPGQDKAVFSMVDTAFIEMHGWNKFTIIGTPGSQIDVVNGKITFREEEVPDDPLDNWSQLNLNNILINIGDNGLLDASTTGAIDLDSTNGSTEVHSNGGMAAKSILVRNNAKLYEQQTMVIDGIGGTTTTRDYFTLQNNGEYFGNLVVDSHVDLPDAHDMIIRSGILHGDLDIRAGKVIFPEGCIEGLVTISGGSVENTEPNTGPPPYVASGISMTGGQLNMAEGSLESGGDISVANGAEAQIGTLSNFGSILSVGSENDTNGGSSLSIGTFDLQPGGMLLADPAWGLAPANVAVESLGSESGDTTLYGSIGVGMNSMVAIGTRDLTWLPEKVSQATSGIGLSQNGVQSALGIYRPLVIASGGGLRVDGSQSNAALAQSLASEANMATFATNSALVLNGADEQMRAGTPAISFEDAAGSAHVYDGAQIFINDAKAGSTYLVVDSSVTPIIYHAADGQVTDRNAATAWEGDNLRASSTMISLTYVDANNINTPTDGQPDTGENRGDSGSGEDAGSQVPAPAPDTPNAGNIDTGNGDDTATEDNVGNQDSGNLPDSGENAGSHEDNGQTGGENGSQDNSAEDNNPASGNTAETGNVQPADEVASENKTGETEPAASEETAVEKETPEENETGKSEDPVDEDKTQPGNSESDRTQIEASVRDVRQVYPSLSSSVASVVTSLYLRGQNDVNSSVAGIRFLSRATDSRFIGDDAYLAASTIESAARMAIAGAVPHMTLDVNNATEEAASSRVGILALDDVQRTDAAVQKLSHSVAVWLMPVYGSANGFGLEAGNFSHDFNGGFGGIAVGADYTFMDNFRAGIAFNMGGGYASSSGDLQKTTNNMDFWGIGAYAGWSNGILGISGDVSYTSTYNKLEQDMPSRMFMADLKSDVTAQALSASLTAEWRLPLETLDIIAHAGARYTTMRVDGHDIKSGGKIAEIDSFTQNIWAFPVGLSFSKEFSMENGWTILPKLDLSIIPATGDLKAKSRGRFAGIDQEMYMESQVRDNVTYGGSAGVQFGYGNFSLAVAYDGQFGSHTTAHGVFGMLKYEF